MDGDRKFVASSMDMGLRSAGTAEFSGLYSKPNYARAKIFKKLVDIKKNIRNKKNISSFLKLQKKELKNNYKIKIDYLELRNINNLKISSTNKNSRLFIAYYINKVRLIDNL